MQILNSTTVFPPVHPMTTNQSGKLGLVMSVGILALALGAFVLLWRLSECWKSYYISRLAQLFSKFKSSETIKAQEKMALQTAQIEGGGGREPSCRAQSTAEQQEQQQLTIEQQEVSPRIPPNFVPRAPRARSSTYAGTSSQWQDSTMTELVRGGGGRLRSSTYAGATQQSGPWPGQDDGNEIRRHVLQSDKETEIRSIQEQEQEEQQQRHRGSRMGSSTNAGPSHSQQQQQQGAFEQTMQLQARERSRTYAGGPSPYVILQQQQECSRPRSSTYTMGERPRPQAHELELEESRRPRLSSSRTMAGELPSQQQRRLRWISSRVPGPGARLHEFDADGGGGGGGEDEDDVEEAVPRILPLQPPSVGENRLSVEQQRNLMIRPPSPTDFRGGMHSHRAKPRSSPDPSLPHSSQGPSSSGAGTYRDRPSIYQSWNAEDAAAVNSKLTMQNTEYDVYDYDIEGEIRPRHSQGTLLDSMAQPPSNSCAGGRRSQIRLGPSSSSGHTKRSSF